MDSRLRRERHRFSPAPAAAPRGPDAATRPAPVSAV